jgi:hypothetical protein
MFLGARSVADGIELPIGRGSAIVRVRVRLCAIIGDEEALNAMLFTKGASGIVPDATLCGVVNKPRVQDVDNNVISLSDVDDSIVDISCPDLDRCGLRSNEDVWALCDDLINYQGKELAEVEHSTGLKRHTETLLYDVPLRAHVHPSHTTGDPMHILFSNGLLSAEVMHFMKYMKSSIGAYFPDVRAFYAEGRWMSKTSHNPLSAISEEKEKHSDETLKCGASELLVIYPLIRAFVFAVYGFGSSEPPVQSLLLLCLICDEVRTLLVGMSGALAEEAAVRLRGLVSRYLIAFSKAYGSGKCRFKHHQLLHIPESIMRLQRMLACFVLERKHLLAKASMEPHKRLKTMSKGGLNGMLNAQVRLLECPGWLNRLEHPSPYPEFATSLGAHSASLSRGMHWNCASAHCNDVLFLNYERTYLVLVVACVSFVPASYKSSVHFGLIVRCGERICSKANDTASVWRVGVDASLYRLVDEPFVHASFFRHVSVDTIEVLH